MRFGCEGSSGKVGRWEGENGHALRLGRVVDQLLPTHGLRFAPHTHRSVGMAPHVHRSVGMAPHAATVWTHKPALAIEDGHTPVATSYEEGIAKGGVDGV
jgi:hypothetical protein